jgi:uncharacterized membrane protein YphA (DoxX/SURF4 family)
MAARLERWTPYVLCLVRITSGLLFLQHGLEKLFGFAGAWTAGLGRRSVVGRERRL